MRKLTIREIQLIEIEIIREVKNIFEKNNIKYFSAAGTLLGAERHKGYIPWDTDADFEIPITDYFKAIDLLKEKLHDKYKVFDHNDDHDYKLLFFRVGIMGLPDEFIHVDFFPLIGVKNSVKSQKKLFNKTNRINKLYEIKKTSIKEVLKDERYKVRIFKLIIKAPLFFIPSFIFHKKIHKIYLQNNYKESDLVANIHSRYELNHVLPKKLFSNINLIEFESLYLPAPLEHIHILEKLYDKYMTIPENEIEKVKKFRLPVTENEYEKIKHFLI